MQRAVHSVTQLNIVFLELSSALAIVVLLPIKRGCELIPLFRQIFQLTVIGGHCLPNASSSETGSASLARVARSECAPRGANPPCGKAVICRWPAVATGGSGKAEFSERFREVEKKDLLNMMASWIKGWRKTAVPGRHSDMLRWVVSNLNEFHQFNLRAYRSINSYAADKTWLGSKKNQNPSSAFKYRHCPSGKSPSRTCPIRTRFKPNTFSPTMSHIRRICRFLPSRKIKLS